MWQVFSGGGQSPTERRGHSAACTRTEADLPFFFFWVHGGGWVIQEDHTPLRHPATEWLTNHFYFHLYAVLVKKSKKIECVDKQSTLLERTNA